MEERKDGKFISIEEIQRRTKLSRSVLEVMEEMGCLGDLPKTSQVTPVSYTHLAPAYTVLRRAVKGFARD